MIHVVSSQPVQSINNSTAFHSFFYHHVVIFQGAISIYRCDPANMEISIIKMRQLSYLYNENLYTQKDCLHIDGLMQERRNSIAKALELSLSCTNPSILRENPLYQWA